MSHSQRKKMPPEAISKLILNGTLLRNNCYYCRKNECLNEIALKKKPLVLLVAIDLLNDKICFLHGRGSTQFGKGKPSFYILRTSSAPSNNEAAIARNC